MLKRFVDFTISILALILMAPLMVVIAALIKLTSSGPVFHRSRRIGRGGQPFVLLKFRTMVAGAAGPGITAARDQRVTRFGRVLRRTKLDELPQLVNVLRGEMSLVGPRPEDPRYVSLYDPEQRRVLSVLPGITSEASVKFRNEEAMLQGEEWEKTYVEVIMPEKLKLELAAIDRSSLRHDMTVLFRTFLAIWR
jgi:lipopolysaccharide/colanic/teichoic acid biosynthesis glycosyltransferase